MQTLELAPGTFSVRAATPDDLEPVFELITASDIAEYGEPDFSLDDLRDEWRHLDLSRDAWVITTPDKQIVGYAALSHRNLVRIIGDGYVHPGHEGKGIGTQLQTLIEARAQELLAEAPEGERVVLRNGTNAANEASRRLLESRGYGLVRHFWRMQIMFDGPPPEPTWPKGITVRPFVLGQDDRLMHLAITEAFLDHWGSVAEPFESWAEHNLQKTDLDTSVWFLAFAGDEVAGAIRCSTMLDLGWVGHLAVRRPWRKHGLGNALLLQAFGVFYRQGRPGVGLGVDSENLTGATRIYERAGMKVTRDFAQFEKELRPSTR